MIRRWMAWWVALWDAREAPWALGMIRLLIGLAMFWDFLWIARLGLVEAVFLPVELGGLVTSARTHQVPWWSLFGTGLHGAYALYGGMLVTSACLALGLFTRSAAFALMMLSAQFAWIHGAGDRGIDTLMRNVLMILMFSSAGKAWSVEALWRSGSFWGDGAETPQWPRRLILLQLVAMYFAAGVSKYAQQWWPWGGYTALWVIWQDWAVSAVAGSAWLDSPGALLFSQVGTFLSITWELTFPAMLWFWWAWRRGTPAWVRRWRPDLAFVALGVTFHLGIAFWLDLGVFSWAMLALYPAFLSGREWMRVFDAIRSRSLRQVAEALRIGP